MFAKGQTVSNIILVDPENFFGQKNKNDSVQLFADDDDKVVASGNNAEIPLETGGKNIIVNNQIGKQLFTFISNVFDHE